MKKFIIFLVLGLIVFGPLSEVVLAKTVVSNQSQYFHKRRVVHKKAPIPKDPKLTKADIKKIAQQKKAGKVYVKQLKGWLRVIKR